MSDQHLSQFTSVDGAGDPSGLVHLMDRARNLSALQICQEEVLAALDLAGGHRALDVGCGSGEQTRELARRVGPDGEAVGVDFSGVMVAEARRRSEGTDLPVRFEEGDAQRLRFDDATFDACRTERMLCHVPDAGAALAEMVRVTRPGGRVAAIEPDMEAVLCASPDAAFTRTFLCSFADSLSHGRMGRDLPRLFRQSGLRDIQVGAHLVNIEFELLGHLWGAHFERLRTSGEVEPKEADRWWAELGESAATGTFLLAVPSVIVSARKP